MVATYDIYLEYKDLKNHTKIAKTFFRLTSLLVIFAVAALFISNSFFNHTKQLTTVSPAPLFRSTVAAPKNEQPSPGLPMRLKIPAINVDAAVESVGITSTGDMGTPKGPTGVAWYKNGPRPGEVGSSVIDGHFGWENGIPAVFDNLYKLHKGDKVYVSDAAGVTYTFVVNESKSYDPKADTAGVFLSSDGKAHLNLITCEGAWNKTQKSYSNRLIVFADKQ